MISTLFPIENEIIRITRECYMVNYNLSTYQNLELIQWIHQDRSQSNTIHLRQKPSWNNFFFLPVSRPLTYYNDKTWKLETTLNERWRMCGCGILTDFQNILPLLLDEALVFYNFHISSCYAREYLTDDSLRSRSWGLLNMWRPPSSSIPSAQTFASAPPVSIVLDQLF